MNVRDKIRHMERMEQALDYMLANVRKKLTIEEVASAKGVEYQGGGPAGIHL